MKRFIFIFSLFVTILGYAQGTPEILLTSPELPIRSGNEFGIEIEALGFFKNNEYFSPVSKGQTFPGIQFRPKLTCQIDNKLRFELGMTGIYYSGDQQKNDFELFNWIFARIQYSIKPNLNLILGNYYGGANHRLIEPLYRWESQIVEKPESGLQLLYNNERFFVDVWLDWQRYIEHGDSVPEILFFGTSLAAELMPRESRFKLSVPLQLTIYHQGGQIDTSDEKMIVSANFATGLRADWSLGNGFIKSAGLDAYVVGYYDKHVDREKRPYAKGWGIYPVAHLKSADFKFMLGYWYARKYFTFDGERLFASFNPTFPDEELLPTRQLVTSKLSYFKQVHKMFSIGGQAEVYYDTKLSNFDYSFGINIRLNTQIFSKSF